LIDLYAANTASASFVRDYPFASVCAPHQDNSKQLITATFGQDD